MDVRCPVCRYLDTYRLGKISELTNIDQYTQFVRDIRPYDRDVFSGNGQNLLVFKELGYNATGIDLNETAVNSIKKKLGLNAINVSLENFESQKKFDCILASHLIEYCICPHTFLSKLKFKRLTKKFLR